MLEKTPKGIILLLTVMTLALVLTVVLGTGTLVINLVRQSTDIDYSIHSFYAAESGIEKNLYRVRQLDWQPVYKEDGISTDDQELLTDFSIYPKYDLEAVNGKDEIIIDLQNNLERELDIYDPTKSASVPLSSVDKIIISGTGHETNDTILHVSYVWWEAGSVSANPNTETPLTVFANQSFSKTINLPFTHLVKLKIRSLGADLENVSVITKDATNNTVATPGIYVLNSTGQYPANSGRSARQVINVEMPVIEPTYGLYNFVIFSEEAINKRVSW